MYRGAQGMYSWAGRRITGLAVVLFLLFHIADTALLLWGPDVYDKVVRFYQLPLFRLGEVALVAAVVYHAVSGLHIIVLDLWDGAHNYQKQLMVLEYALFAVLFFAAAYFMLVPWLTGHGR
jgi:succinate dehydrogenase / fumarate reductase cytochrome b subunit